MISYFERVLVVLDDYNEEEEEMEGEYEGEEVNDVENEEKSEELACPFCLEDFDVLGLCCHIDADHRMEVKPGVIRRKDPLFCSFTCFFQ